MNKITTFCLILLGIILPVNAQIYTPNGAIQGSSNGNVGIGTTTPESGYKIDVNGSATIGNAGSTRVYIGSLDANTSYLQSRNTTINKNLSIVADNVGIGTTTPAYKLDVSNTVGISNATSSANTLVGSITFKQTNSSGFELTKISTIQETANVYEGALLLSTNTTGNAGMSEKMRITSGGNVGIGTTLPINKLTVRKDGGGSSITVLGSALGTSNDTGIDFSVDNSGVTPIYARIGLGVNSGSLGGETGYLQFSTINGAVLSEKMRILANGNIGIGTTNPTSKLTVKGKIHTEEVKVDLAIPADYVFEKYYTGESELKADYILPTLAEVEKYTQANHHLPNVPSAAEIKENGLLLGEMSNILLQKIEELTLYTIEQQKTIERQSASIEKLEKENKAFKSLSERLSKLENQIK